MEPLDPRLARALGVQLQAWRETLRGGAERVGWKVGAGDRERIGPGPVIGHLTSATRLDAGATYRPRAVAALHADAEIALELGADVGAGASREQVGAAIAGVGPALELVDLAPAPGGPEEIVATNVFHRAFALGPMHGSRRPDRVVGRLTVDGQTRGSAPATPDLLGIVQAVANILAAVGLRLEAGDRLITGAVVQVPVGPGDAVTADLGALGSVRLAIAP